MPQIINTNIASLNAQRNLNNAQRSNESALQRLSSGLRINSAKDDAAGLAISTRFDSQIRGTQTAIRNSGDAISLAQTAESALSSMTNSLQRIRELSVQSANDTNTDVDRQALQEEVNQLVDEINNIAEKTNFNGKKLLDGSFQNSVFQTGANVGDTITLSVSKLDTSTLGSAVKAGVSSSVSINSAGSPTAIASDASTGSELVAGDLVINGVAISASSGVDDTSSTAQSASSSIAKAAAINKSSELTGVTAVVNENVVQGQNLAASASTSATVTINGVSVDLSTSTALSVEQNLTNVASSINLKSGASGVTANVVVDGTSYRIDLSAADGRNIAIGGTAATASFGIAASAAASTSNVYVGTYTLISEDGSDINLSSNTGNIDSAGFEEGSFNGVTGGVVSDNGTTAALTTGDLVINDIAVGPSKASSDVYSINNAEGSAISKAAAINSVSGQTGVTATANANTIYSGDISSTTAATDFDINGVTVSVSYATTADSSTRLATVIDAINNKVGQTGVRAEALDADSFKLVADDGRNITLGTSASVYGTTLSATTHVASIALESGGKFTIGSNTGDAHVAGLRIGTYGGAETGTKLQDLDITTVDGANAAIKAVDNALQTITSKQAELGAVQNRFQNTISNLESLNENLNAANSRVKDADFAAETAALSKSQVLQQAGISVLAQANAKPQQVLSLLG